MLGYKVDGGREGGRDGVQHSYFPTLSFLLLQCHRHQWSVKAPQFGFSPVSYRRTARWHHLSELCYNTHQVRQSWRKTSSRRTLSIVNHRVVGVYVLHSNIKALDSQQSSVHSWSHCSGCQYLKVNTFHICLGKPVGCFSDLVLANRFWTELGFSAYNILRCFILKKA